MFAAGVALLLAFGVQASSLLYLGVLLACPLMMFVVMRGMMGGGHDHTDGNADRDLTEPTP